VGTDHSSTRQTARLMLKMGCLAFGGPSAHIAMLEDEVVELRQWMSRQHFLDLVGATNLIPGPNSTEMMMHVGYERLGWLSSKQLIDAIAVGQMTPGPVGASPCWQQWRSFAFGCRQSGWSWVVASSGTSSTWSAGSSWTDNHPRDSSASGP